jgi:Family of unknown function (DUF6339)
MIYKLTNRSRLRNSSWVSDIRALEWQDVRPPPREGLGVQTGDLICGLDGDSVVHRIQDKVLSLANDGIDRVTSDGPLAEFIHRTLNGITLREASDPEFWTYLVSFGCPQYLRWRWPKPDADLKSRCAGDIHRNAFSALWWWAQASHDPDKSPDDPERYIQTRTVRGRTSFVLYCIDCAFSGHNPLVRKLCAIQQRHSLDDIASKKLGRSVNRIAKVVCLDGLRSDGEVHHFSTRAYEVSLQLQ